MCVAGCSDVTSVIDVVLNLQTHEFEIPRTKAEKVLQQHGGDINKALRSLVVLST